MKSRNTKLLLSAPALLMALSLSGCLMDSAESTAAPADANPPPSGNNAPVISGNPPSAVTVGEAYSFTPQASDSDGDTLTFSVSNLPSWAVFDTGSGQVSGAPTLADIGSYTNIGVSVSDGTASASMSGFTIDVTQVGTASTTLSWTAPTLNEDGTSLTDLAGYKIYYGRSPNSYSNQIRIDNPSVTTYMVESLSVDTTYYFAATAFNTLGIESRFSSEATVTVN